MPVHHDSMSAQDAKALIQAEKQQLAAWFEAVVDAVIEGKNEAARQVGQGLQAICQFFVGVREVVTEVVQELTPVFQGLRDFAQNAGEAVAQHCKDMRAQREHILAHLERLQAAFETNDFETIDQFLLEELKLRPSDLCKNLRCKSKVYVDEDTAMRHYRIALLSFIKEPNKLMSHIKAAIIFTNLPIQIRSWIFSAAIDWVKNHIIALEPWRFFGHAKGSKLQSVTDSLPFESLPAARRDCENTEKFVLDKLGREERLHELFSMRCELISRQDSSSRDQVSIIDALFKGQYDRRKEILEELDVSESSWRALSQRLQRREHKSKLFLTG